MHSHLGAKARRTPLILIALAISRAPRATEALSSDAAAGLTMAGKATVSRS
jgi:hypothetical protein